MFTFALSRQHGFEIYAPVIRTPYIISHEVSHESNYEHFFVFLFRFNASAANGRFIL